MVKREKVVVVLLLVTIILSILSVVVTLAIPGTASADNNAETISITEDDSVGIASFEIEPRPDAGG